MTMIPFNFPIVIDFRSSKETIESIKIPISCSIQKRLTRYYSMLTIAFTFSTPAIAVGTFYGMNINLPGDRKGPWTFLGKYTTLIIVVIISAASALPMYWYLHKVGWITYTARHKT
jgi:magnesium transporter